MEKFNVRLGGNLPCVGTKKNLITLLPQTQLLFICCCSEATCCFLLSYCFRSSRWTIRRHGGIRGLGCEAFTLLLSALQPFSVLQTQSLHRNTLWRFGYQVVFQWGPSLGGLIVLPGVDNGTRNKVGEQRGDLCWTYQSEYPKTIYFKLFNL